MKLILAIVLLLTLSTSISQLSYTFSAAANSAAQTPSYYLGSISQGATVDIKIELAYTGFTLSTSNLLLSIMDGTNANVVQAFNGNVPMQCTGSKCTVVWNAQAANTYYLQVQSLTAIEQSRLVVYYLTASTNNQTFLKVTDVLRQNVVKQFYIGTSGDYSFSLTPTTSSSFYLTLLKMDPTDSLRLRVSSAADLTPTDTTNNIGTYNISLAVGFYGIIVHTATASSVTVKYWSDPYYCPYSSSYNDYYSVFNGCSFSTTTSVSSSAYPCTNYDYTNNICVGCANGYVLNLGICTISNNCGARQYSSYGVCYNVSDTCGQFDAYTGACQTCITSAYYLASGQCLTINCGLNLYYSVSQSACVSLPVTCANFSIATEQCSSCNAGSYLYNGSCNQYPNSANCKLFSFPQNVCAACNTGYSLQNGACSVVFVCASGQQLVNGICILNPTTCSSNQVLINSQCVQLPANCLGLNIYYQCTQCAQNYQIVAGYCQPCTGSNPNFPCVTCPQGQYLDNNGNCQYSAPVTIQFCLIYSGAGNSCQTCNNGQPPNNGMCCDSGQQLNANGQCDSPQSSSSGSGSNLSGGFARNFKIYGYCGSLNVQTKTCIACLPGHSMVGNYCP